MDTDFNPKKKMREMTTIASKNITLVKTVLLKTCLFTLLLVWCTNTVQAQNPAFPVSIKGSVSLPMPASLVLSDYGNNKAADILFSLELLDPVEPFREVFFNITILNDRAEIMSTNLDFVPNTFRLNQFTPEMITGDDLAAYFNVNNMLSVSGGIPGDLLPEGYNSICIEVIDAERMVPISERFCANGFFNLNAPPLMTMPDCGGVVNNLESPNILFQWQPLHLGSPNAPMIVEYEFKLVELPEGYDNANDVFEFAIPIYETTVSNPILIYTDDLPPLTVGNKYAWRVRAFDAMEGLDLFINGGYSEICEFDFEEIIIGGPNNDGSGCAGSPCDLDLSDVDQNPRSNPLLVTGEELKIGFFVMTLSEDPIFDYGGETYMGTGTIYLPFINTKLRVEFEDIQVNDDSEIYAGTVSTIEDIPNIIPASFSDENMQALSTNVASLGSYMSDQAAASLSTFIEDPLNAPTRLISSWKDEVIENAPEVGLPLGFDVEGSNTIALTAIVFTPSNAKMNAVFSTQLSAGSPWIKFGIRGLCLRQNGPAVFSPKLALLDEVDLEQYGVMPITLEPMDDDGGGTYISWDCGGFEEFSLQGRYEFGPDNLIPLDEDIDTLIATFNTKAYALTEFITQVKLNSDFYISGLEDFPFTVGDIYLDFADSTNAEGMTLPEDYIENEKSWKGMFISSCSVELPDLFHSTGSTAGTPVVRSDNAIFDLNGFTGSLIANNLIDAADGGSLGEWAFTLDSFYLNIAGNSLVNSGFDGGIRLPIMNEDESIPYEASLVQVDSNDVDTWDIAFEAKPDTVSIDLLRAKISFDEESKITVGRENGVFQTPVANLSGVMTTSISINDAGFTQDIKNEIAAIEESLSSLGITGLYPDFTCDGIKFTGMVLDMAAENKFTIESIKPLNSSLKFLGTTSDLDNINFLELSLPDSLPNVNLKNMGFVFKTKLASSILRGLAPTVTFTLKIQENTLDPLNPNFDFLGYDLDFSLPDINIGCTSDLEELVIGETQHSGPFTADSITVGRFMMSDINIISDSQTGIISGNGVIDMPLLGPLSKVNVEFTEIKINDEGAMMEGKVNVAVASNLPDMNDSGALISSIRDQMSAVTDLFSLPFLIGESPENGLTIIGLEFQPDQAVAKAKLIIDLGGGEYAQFSAEGMNIVPNGIASFDTKVMLAEDFEFEPIDGVFPLSFKKFDKIKDEGSYISCDCDGFQSFNLLGDVTFPREMFEQKDSINPFVNTAVTGRFAIESTEWGKFMGTISGLDSFHITGLDDLPISLSEGLLDFSTAENHEGMEFPEGYGEDMDSTWQGFILPTLTIELPEILSTTVEGKLPSIQGFNVLIDSLGMSGRMSAVNLISADNGTLGGLPFSLDSINIDFMSNDMTSGKFTGELQLPIMEDGEGMPYEGEFMPMIINGYPDLNFTFEAKPEKVKIDILKSEFSFDTTSTISVGRADGNFLLPSFDLSGTFTVNVEDGDAGFAGDVKSQFDELKSILEGLGLTDIIPSLDLDSINFSGMKLDLNDAKDKFQIASITPQNVDMSFLGMNWDLSGMDFGKYFGSASDSTATSPKDGFSLKKLAMNFDLGLELPSLPDFPASFKIKLKELSDASNPKNTKYSFDGFALDFKMPGLPEFNCAEIIALAAPESETPADEINKGQKIKVGAFEMKVTEITTASGAGAEGKGTIDIPFVGYTMNVSFDGVKVNEEGQIYEGDVFTDTDVSLLPAEVSDFNPDLGIPFLDPLKSGLQDKLADVKDFMTLPISIKDKLAEATGLEMPFDIILMGLAFNKEGAQMNISISVPTGVLDDDLNEKFITFGGRGLDIRPDGINLGELQLFLAQDITMDDYDLPLRIVKGDGSKDGGSYITFTCDGFQEFNLQAEYAFPRDQLTPTSAGSATDSVVARFAINTTEWGEFTAFAEIDSFEVVGLDDVVFFLDSAFIDYSATAAAPSFPADYIPPAGAVDETWKGFYMQELYVKLPPSIASFNNGDDLIISASDVIFDRANGLTGSLLGENILELSEGSLDGWAFSIDSFELDIQFNSIEKFQMNGFVHIPVTSEEDTINYTALFSVDEDGNSEAEFSLEVDGTYEIPFLENSKMELEEVSVVGVRYRDGKYEPFADVSGGFVIQLGGSGPVPEFNLPELEFEHFKINDTLIASTSTENTGGLDKISFGAFSFDGISIPELPDSENSGSSGGDSYGINYLAYSNALKEGAKKGKLSGFPINIDSIKFTSFEENGINYKKLGFILKVNFTSSDEGKGIAADGGIGIVGRLDFGKLTSTPWEAFIFDKVELSSLSVNIDLGQVKISGGISHFQAHEKYGSGYKGFLSMEIKPSIKVDVIGQFGTTSYSNGTTDFRYWFADAQALFSPGIQLSSVRLMGISGGVYYHMSPGLEAADSQKGPAPLTDAEKLTPGINLSGIVYEPDIKSYLKLEAGVTLALADPNAFNADARFNITFSSTGSVLNMGFKGDAYIMAPIDSREDAKITAHLDILFDFKNEVIVGTLDAYIDIPLVLTGAYENNRAGRIDMYFNWSDEKSTWHILVGTPQNPISVLYYGAGIEGYFMAGENLPPFKQLREFNVNLAEFEAKKSAIPLGGNGFAFGARLSIGPYSASFLMFEASFAAGVGFDVAMTHISEPLDCDGPGPEPAKIVGIDGWYLQGQAYAYIDVKVDIFIDTWFYEGRINIMEMNLAAALQAKLPNPSWMKGDVKGSYSVLGGMVKGSMRFGAEFGEECIAMSGPPNPVAGISLIGDAYPADGTKDVEIFTDIKAAFKLRLNEAITFPVYENDEPVNYVMKPVFKSIEIYEKGSNVKLDGEVTYNVEGDFGRGFKPYDMLKPNTEYEWVIAASWEKSDGNRWQAFLDEDKNEVIDTLRQGFKTGAFPTEISQNMISYQAPGYRQQFWHDGYAEAIIEFGQNGVYKLFEPAKYRYQIKIGSNAYDVTKYPTSYYDKEITFAAFENFNLEKNAIYDLQIIAIPKSEASLDETVSTVQDSLSLVQLDEENEEFTAKDITRKFDLEDKAFETKLIYTNSFGTSRYNSLADKLSSVHQEASWPLDFSLYNTLQMTHDTRDISVNLSHLNTQNGNLNARVYTAKRITYQNNYLSRPEGFDKYDLVRLNLNLTFKIEEDSWEQKHFENEDYYNLFIQIIHDAKVQPQLGTRWGNGIGLPLDDLQYLLWNEDDILLKNGFHSKFALADESYDNTDHILTDDDIYYGRRYNSANVSGGAQLIFEYHFGKNYRFQKAILGKACNIAEDYFTHTLGWNAGAMKPEYDTRWWNIHNAEKPGTGDARFNHQMIYYQNTSWKRMDQKADPRISNTTNFSVPMRYNYTN